MLIQTLVLMAVLYCVLHRVGGASVGMLELATVVLLPPAY